METPTTVSIRCIVCKELITINTTVEALARRESGMKVQDAFPDMPLGEREMFTGSRTCSSCFDKLFPEEEEEEDDDDDSIEPGEDLEDLDEFLNTLGIHEVIHIDMGTRVLCDTCNKEYTAEDGIVGGLLFNRHACCPDCAPGMWDGAMRCNETHLVTNARDGETFYNFVMRMR